MAALRSVHSSDRIIQKLNKLMESCEYYEAHQLYRTIYFRYLNTKRFKELESLLYDGALLLLKKQQFNSGADVASLYIDALNKDPDIANVLKNNQECDQLCRKIGELVSLIPSQSPERLNFMIVSLKLKPEIFPIPLIHHQFALILWREKNFTESRYHFLHCGYSCGEDCALMLIEYHITCGFPSEVDLFITQFILQLLCLRKSAFISNYGVTPRYLESSKPSSSNCNDRLKLNSTNPRSSQHAFANITLQSYIAKHPQIQKNDPPFLLPLINFLWFLLLAIDSGKSATFNILRELYATALKRDPAYNEYLTRIGELYFGLKGPSQQRDMGFLSSFFQSFLEDGDDENETSGPSKPLTQHASEDLD